MLRARNGEHEACPNRAVRESELQPKQKDAGIGKGRQISARYSTLKSLRRERELTVNAVLRKPKQSPRGRNRESLRTRLAPQPCGEMWRAYNESQMTWWDIVSKYKSKRPFWPDLGPRSREQFPPPDAAALYELYLQQKVQASEAPLLNSEDSVATPEDQIRALNS